MYTIYNNDCLLQLDEIEEKSVDCIITDPPYEFYSGNGGGAFGRDKRAYHGELYNGGDLDCGVQNIILDKLWKVMKKPNIYIFCNKNQLRQYINYFEDKGCTTDLLTWHKTNPVPTCNNKYLSDTEYLLFFRKGGVPLYGSYATKRKWYVSPTNKGDKEKYKHPTIKPLEIIKNLVINSTKEGDLVLDPFMGSGTTGAACMELGRNFIGIEKDAEYCEIAKARIEHAKKGAVSY